MPYEYKDRQLILNLAFYILFYSNITEKVFSH